MADAQLGHQLTIRLSAVDVALAVEGDEHLEHRAGVLVVHREPLVVEVEPAAQPLVLLDDLGAVLAPPLPDALHEGLASQVVARLPVLPQLLLHHVLGGDAGVVGAADPQRLVALHAAQPDQRVLDRAVQRVAHVQRAGHVGRRHGDRVRRPVGVRVGGERAGGLPLGEHARLDGSRLEAAALPELVACGDRHGLRIVLTAQDLGSAARWTTGEPCSRCMPRWPPRSRSRSHASRPSGSTTRAAAASPGRPCSAASRPRLPPWPRLPRSRGALRLAALPLCATVGRPRRGRRAAPRRAAAQRAGTRRRRPGRAGAGRRSAAAAAAQVAASPRTGRGTRAWSPSHGCWPAPGCRPPVWRSPRRASRASTASTWDTTRAWTARCSPGTRCSSRGGVPAPSTRWYLALMLTYGVAVAAQDAWLEQVVKRGWTSRRMPDVVRPALRRRRLGSALLGRRRPSPAPLLEAVHLLVGQLQSHAARGINHPPQHGRRRVRPEPGGRAVLRARPCRS